MSNSFYIISTNSYIKSIPNTFLSMEFLKELKTNNNQLKPHVNDLDSNAIYYGKKCIKCTIPTIFISIEYKDINKDTYLIDHEVLLYSEDMPNMEALENYKNKFNFNFASQVDDEVYVILDAFHNGYGCMCLSSGDY